MMESLKDKIRNTQIEYEQSDIYYQVIGIVVILVIIAVAVLFVTIDYSSIPVIGLFIEFSKDVILKILNLFSWIIRRILDLF
ncbi:MAG: hypothetical protein LUF02_03215 [Erysipelotrichaceae bacterium]|nr:hypothetical protein [Erysipelotrichaceae bacterium]